MAYNTKYSLTFRDNTFISNKLWKVLVFENGFGGSVTNVVCGGSPIQIDYKKGNLETAICGSELTLHLQATTAGQYDEFLTAAPLQYYITVLYSSNNGVTWVNYWYGVNTTDTYSQAHSNVPYDCNVKFNCGLGELQWHRYENNGNLTTGLEQIAQIVNNCLSFLPYTFPLREIVNVREDTMSDTSGLMEQLFINDMAITEIGSDGQTHGWNCNKLLNNILSSINCRMYQSNGRWFIERIYERVNASVEYFDYTLSGSWQTNNSITHAASGTLNWTRTINNSSFPRIIKTSEKAVTQLQPILSYKFSVNNINNVELIPNAFLENTPLDKDANNRPLRWVPSSGYPFTCSPGGTVLTFTSSAIANGFSIGTVTYQFVQLGVLYNRTVTARSGATITISSHMSLTAPSGNVTGVVQIGGDGLETIDQYDTDVKYQSGYSFGSKIVNDNYTYQNNNCPYLPAGGYAAFNGSPYSIHALRNPADTYTYPLIVLDPDNSEIIVNIRQYIRIKVTPQYTSKPTYAQTYADAMTMGAWGYSLFYFQFKNVSSGDSYYMYGQEQVQTGAPVGFIKDNSVPHYFCLQWTTQELFANFPYQTGTGKGFSGPMNGGPLISTIQSWLANSWSPKVGGGGVVNPFYICFDTTTSQNIQLNTSPAAVFPSSPATYSFDCKVFPPYSPPQVPVPGTLNPYGGTVQIALDDWALRALDLQYKDNSQSASSNMAFYSTNAGSTRWNELDINATFGDTSSTGFPGSFFTSSNVNTTTWHNVGVGDTGQTLVDIFFMNFAQIPAYYRPNLKGNVIFDDQLEFYHTVQDEDGELYIQLGHTVEPKLNSFRTDMEGMADTGLPITPIHVAPFTPWVRPAPQPAPIKPPSPITGPTGFTPVSPITNRVNAATFGYPI
jgi:hypothetical protein